MKRISLFALISCMCYSLSSNAQTSPSKGIQFFKGSWKELLNEAKKQQKLVFVDVYTDWCGPCKQMDSDIFPLPQVGEVYNKLFINYRLNAEKGEGIQLAKQYSIKFYPTYLFLDDAGNVLDRSGDYQPAVTFIALGKRAAAKKDERGNLSEFKARYEKGDRQPDFLNAYLVKRTSLSLDNSEILNEYVKALSERALNEPDEILFLSRNMGRTVSAALPLLMARLHLLNNAQKQEVTDRLYNNLLSSAFGKAIHEKRFDDAAKHLDEINAILPFLSNQHPASLDKLKLRYFSGIKDVFHLKSLGYSLAAKQMAIPADTIVKKDRELFQLVMKPFLSGEKDSLRIPGFSEEKKFVARQYSGGIALWLHEISSAFLDVLQPGDKGLNDALAWATYAYSLVPNENRKALCDKLRAKLNNEKIPKDK